MVLMSYVFASHVTITVLTFEHTPGRIPTSLFFAVSALGGGHRPTPYSEVAVILSPIITLGVFLSLVSEIHEPFFFFLTELQIMLAPLSVCLLYCKPLTHASYPALVRIEPLYEYLRLRVLFFLVLVFFFLGGGMLKTLRLFCLLGFRFVRCVGNSV